MKMILLACFLLAPGLAFAGNAANPPANASGPCRFSKKVLDHNVIEYAKKETCDKKICNHVLICGKYAKVVNCKAKNGLCDGYDADECMANATMADAEYQPGTP